MIKDIASSGRADLGQNKIDWARERMPVLENIRHDFKKGRFLKGYRIGVCLHVTSESANLLITLKEAGAQVSLCASNPLSTQDDVAAALVKNHRIPVFAVHGENKKIYYNHIKSVLNFRPHMTLDDGADLISAAHKMGAVKNLIGGSEETTTGIIRLRAMESDGALKVPVIAVNDSATKHLFDNKHGTGQSTIDGILRATNILLAGKKAVVSGYGWCGRGIAKRLAGMNAIVTITEVDPVRALEAAMDGYNVDSISSAAKYGDLFITATGNKNVISLASIRKMKNGAILANSGHFNVEFDYDGLIRAAKRVGKLRDNLEEIILTNGKKVFALGEGRLVNLVAAEGHPAEVMDMSFTNQAMAMLFLVRNKGQLESKVYTLPKEIDELVAGLKLKSMGITTDTLTGEQKTYLSSWREGT